MPAHKIIADFVAEQPEPRQANAAKRLQVSLSYMSRLCSGARQPTARIADAIDREASAKMRRKWGRAGARIRERLLWPSDR